MRLRALLWVSRASDLAPARCASSGAAQPQTRSRHETLAWSHNGSRCAPLTLRHIGACSGGQNSLCALAFLLAASFAGSAPCALLVDEVDAALDGPNAATAAEMLARCCRENHCLCVAASHSHAFHAHCSAFLRTVKDEEGNTVVKVEPAAK